VGDGTEEGTRRLGLMRRVECEWTVPPALPPTRAARPFAASALGCTARPAGQVCPRCPTGDCEWECVPGMPSTLSSAPAAADRAACFSATVCVRRTSVEARGPGAAVCLVFTLSSAFGSRPARSAENKARALAPNTLEAAMVELLARAAYAAEVRRLVGEAEAGAAAHAAEERW